MEETESKSDNQINFKNWLTVSIIFFKVLSLKRCLTDQVENTILTYPFCIYSSIIKTGVMYVFRALFG